MPKSRKAGRPSKLTAELAEEICRRLSHDSVRAVFEDPEMPSRQSFYNWLRGDPEFFDRSARARAIAALREMDEAERKLDEADDVTNVPLLRERLQHCRWKVSKLLPNTYGDKVALTGPGGGPLAVSRIEWVIVDPEESEE